MLHQVYKLDIISLQHSINVGILAQKFSKYLNSKLLFNINERLARLCGELHDIGKIKVNQNILNKESKLTDEEFSHIKKHPEFGVEHMQSLGFSLPEEVLNCILYHHKGYTNNGYPSVNSDIPDHILKYVDIISICDIYDALLQKRSYKEGFSVEKSLDIMDTADINPYLYQHFKDFIKKDYKRVLH